MTAIQQVQQAKVEGLKFFWARNVLGSSIEFAGHSWEDGGFSVNEVGEPRRDSNGNKVARFEVEELVESYEEHAEAVSEWHKG